jgi:hypothetical protein
MRRLTKWLSSRFIIEARMVADSARKIQDEDIREFLFGYIEKNERHSIRSGGF